MPSRDRYGYKSRGIRRALRIGVIALLLVFFGYIPYIMVVTSIQQPVDVVSGSHFVSRPTLQNYDAVLSLPSLQGMLVNSLIVGLMTIGLALALGLPAAYAIARRRRRRVGLAIVGTRAIPAISLLIPFFAIFQTLGLLDTRFGLALTHLVYALPLVTWLMIGFFEDIPVDLDEAAYVDGASPWQAFLRIVLPLSRGGIAATSILAFIFSWNNLIFVAAIGGPNSRTAPMVAFQFVSFEAIQWGRIAAAATVIALPVILLAVATQRHIISGLTSAAVKR